MNNDIEILKRALQREKAARKEAERILEVKSNELFVSNKKLAELNNSLEEELSIRAREVVELAKFPEQNPNPIFRFDESLECLYHNNSAKELKQVFKEEKVVWREFSALIKASFKKGTELKKRLVCREKVYDFTVAPFENNKYVNCYGVDVTERIKAQEEVQKSQQQYRTLIEVADDVIYKTNKYGKFTFVNPKVIELSGYTEKEIIGMSYLDLIRDDFKEKAQNFYLEQLKSKTKTSYFEYPVLTKTGKMVWLGQNVKLEFEGDDFVGYFGIARDITEKVIAKQQLKESEEKYRGIIENLELGLLEVDNEELIVKAYPWFCKLTGYDEHELIGKKASDIFLDENGLKIMREQNEIRDVGLPGVYEVEMIRKDGEYMNVLISGAPIFDGAGNRIGSVGIHWDITNRKIAERELELAKEEAEKSLVIRQNFLANMSHEIRTPMNAIVGMSNLLEGSGLSDEQKRYNLALKDSASNLLVLIDDILDFSKIEAGKLDIEIIPFKLQDVLDKMTSLFSLKAREKSIDFIVKSDIDSEQVLMGDPVRLSQVLTNLISNAIKFTDSGKVMVKVYFKGGLNIEVIDTGKGISSDKIDQVFDPFRQEDEGITRYYGGTGLGLSITKNLVELMDGDVFIESEINIGTKFTIYLPYRKTDKQPLEFERAEKVFVSSLEKHSLPDAKILLVEDNDINIFMATSIIEKWKSEVVVAKNGREALECLRKQTFDIVLMDMQMPVMNGVDATIKIREELKSDIPIIALTANAIKGEKEKCLAAGMNDYLSKPFNPNVLFIKIARQLGLVQSEFDVPQQIDRENKEAITDGDTSLFRTDKLKALSNGNEMFVSKMVGMFLESCPKDISEMKNCLKKKDLIRVGEIAHKLKPSIDYLSIQRMSDDVRLIEKLEKRQEVPEQKIKSFMSDLERLLIEMSQYGK